MKALKHVDGLLSTIGALDYACKWTSFYRLWHVWLSGDCQPSLCLTLTESPLKGDDNQEDRSFADSSLFNHWGQDLGPESRRVALKMFQYYGYNGYLSDRLSMDRPIPDYRPNGWVYCSQDLRLPVCLEVLFRSLFRRRKKFEILLQRHTVGGHPNAAHTAESSV